MPLVKPVVYKDLYFFDYKNLNIKTNIWKLFRFVTNTYFWLFRLKLERYDRYATSRYISSRELRHLC